MNSYLVDINADVGEGLNNESDLMAYLSSCNIACGGHAGDLQTMAHVVRLAKMHKVKIGAHPSFPDKENFGRVVVDMPAADLYASLKQQIRALQNILRAENVQLHHIKPHGALYNLAAKDEKTAKVIIEVVKSIALPTNLYVPYGSVIERLAREEEIRITYEAFADRNYNDDLSLVSRKNNNAILNDKHQVLGHVLNMVKGQNVKTVTGVEVSIKASTFCVHGDTKNALEILRYLSQELPKNNINIQ
ncbi:5-oxoprolinase subunit PxpA [Winogradskyella flava]|uniref:5-oxoprolinase subunit PxpA n=1 Tax=Winogradskyella flava TaxID=1884876 RepID=A0A842IUE1_9FLAO|nr:5-oxoprolinase subunit PxpA [Winogradskyella flava]MBC2845353.1 5-oxoprolinase subunit PxpA [Winogradskyella flava]